MRWRRRKKGWPMRSVRAIALCESLAELQAQFSRAMLETRLAPRPVWPPPAVSAFTATICTQALRMLCAPAIPSIERLVGEDFFKGAASLFIGASSSHPRPVLIEYGEAFPAFLESFEPARGLPYLADVARLEWLRHAAYHAADRVPLAAPGPRRRSAGAARAAYASSFTLGRPHRLALPHRQHLGRPTHSTSRSGPSAPSFQARRRLSSARSLQVNGPAPRSRPSTLSPLHWRRAKRLQKPPPRPPPMTAST